MKGLPDPAAIGRVLLVSTPTRIHPRLERLAAGAPIDELNVHQLSKPAQLAVWKSHMRWLRANPRGPAYMLQTAAAVLGEIAPHATVDVLADAPMAEAVASSPLVVGGVSIASDRDVAGALDASLAATRYDLVILLYRDAIGLRWSAVDRAAMRGAPDRVFVLNGRRRLFRLDAGVWTALRRRRALEISWAPELLFATAAVGGAAVLAVYDALTGAARRGGALSEPPE